MNTPVLSMCIKDELDQHLYGKPLKLVLDTYVGYALGHMQHKEYDKAEDYMLRAKLIMNAYFKYNDKN